MLKVVVYDSGMGGELFASFLKEEVPVLKVVPVIDRKNTKLITRGRFKPRKIVEDALKPYIGNADMIVLANHQLTITTLDYLKRHYPNQKFIGFDLPEVDTFVNRKTLTLSTSAVSKSLAFRRYVKSLRRDTVTVNLDLLPALIDSGKLKMCELRSIFIKAVKFNPREIIIACSHFHYLESPLRRIYSSNIKIHTSYRDVVRRTCKELKLRGYRVGKK